MARNCVSIIFPDSGQIYAPSYVVSSGGAATIAAGSPTKSTTVGAVVPMVDADGTTSQKFAGIAKNDSTDTASAAGTVNVYAPYLALVFACKAKTASLANTAALIAALCFKRVVFDLTATGGTWTIDTAAANAATNGVVIVGGDAPSATIYFAISPQITVFDNPTTA